MSDEKLTESGRTISVDKKFHRDVDGGKYSNVLFTRLVAKDRSFTKVNFRYSFFEHKPRRLLHLLLSQDSADLGGREYELADPLKLMVKLEQFLGVSR
jgi:hypothetical protein